MKKKFTLALACVLAMTTMLTACGGSGQTVSGGRTGTGNGAEARSISGSFGAPCFPCCT